MNGLNWMSLALIVITAALPAFSQDVTPETVLDYMLEQVEEVRTGENPGVFDFAEGMVYYRALRYETALDRLMRAYQASPDNVAVINAIADCHYRLNDYEAAAEWYRRTLNYDASFPTASRRLGLSLERLNQPEEALEAHLKSIEADTSDAVAYYYAAKQYFDLEQYDKAAEYAQRSRDLSDIYSEPIYLQAQIARQRGDMDRARELLDEFRAKKSEEYADLDQAPRIDDAESSLQTAVTNHLDLSLVLLELGRRSDALRQLNKAVSLMPDSEEIRSATLKQALDYNLFAFAEEQLQWMLDRRPGSGTLAYRMGTLLAMQGKYAEAEPYMQQAVSQLDDNAAARLGLGQILLRQNRDHGTALALLQEAVELEESPEAYDLLSWALFANGRIDDSIAAMQRAIELDPQNPAYPRKLQQIKSRKASQ